MKVAIVSNGLQTESRSRILARTAHDDLTKRGVEAIFVDMRSFHLPLCDAEEQSLNHPNASRLKEIFQSVDGFILATPVYNFGPNSTLKNLIELTGGAWANKVVGFLCAAGGHRSYMSIMATANSLMLDFRCLIIPKFVYAVKDDFTGEGVSPEIQQRIEEQNSYLLKLCAALSPK